MTPTRFRWFIIFLLFAITVVNYIDRAAISYAIPLMQRDLGLSPADTGTILGAFGLGYAVTTLIGGFAVDRYGARLVLNVAALLWSLSIGATALAGGFVVLYAARVLRSLAADFPLVGKRPMPMAKGFWPLFSIFRLPPSCLKSLRTLQMHPLSIPVYKRN